MGETPDQMCHYEVCVTCSDEGRRGEVIAAPESAFAPALVRTDGGEESVDVTVVGPVRPGDVVLVHAGVAIANLGPEAVVR